ncbi:hypothetical protein WN51_04772 [Melipona quadrifasciata]|uniref:Uncharacterized protein n=1 Tax=Melipona quadrifasciata TaxID=166423 RepID=A0A0M8ZVG8_9HYME|nr:hypothetical protein WN51_04772 [Melipona quadrifasciata]
MTTMILGKARNQRVHHYCLNEFAQLKLFKINVNQAQIVLVLRILVEFYKLVPRSLARETVETNTADNPDYLHRKVLPFPSSAQNTLDLITNSVEKLFLTWYSGNYRSLYDV